MEWLSHSNKKHCELCKTPFRFTKLYDSHMPHTLPLPIFFKRACVHTLGYLLTWARAITVALVWLVILPWCIRWSWRGLFWFLDAGWARDPWLAKIAAPSSPPHANQPADTLSISTQPIALSLSRFFLNFFLYPLGPTTMHILHSSANTTHNASPVPSYSSLLSDVSAVNSLTQYDWLNRFILDTLEGEIITILVVIAFILVFLIREWVVQQQPIINAAAHIRDAELQLDDAERAAQRLQDLDNEAQLEDEEIPPRAQQRHLHLFEQPSSESDDSEDRDGHFLGWHAMETLMDNAGVPHEFEGEDHDEYMQGLEEASEELLEQLKLAEDEGALPAEIARNLWAILDNIDPTERDLWREILLRESQTKYIMLSNLPDKSEDSDHQQPEGGSVSSDSATQSESEENVHGSSRRPIMPPRDASSHAQRVLQSIEESSNNPESSQDHGLDTDADADAVSSRGSWQSITASSHPEGSVVPEVSHSSSLSPTENSQDGEGTDALDVATESSPANPQWSGANNEGHEDSAESVLSDLTLGAEDPTRFSSPATEVTTNPVDHVHASLPQDATSQAVQVAEPRLEESRKGPISRLFDWFWADIILEEEDNAPLPGIFDEEIIGNEAEEPPFVHIDGGQPDREPENAQDPEVLQAAAEAGLDAEAIEDAEDLEGVLELIGMQGPLVGLLQTAMFCGVLITTTLGTAIGLPYLFGKIALLFLGHPITTMVMAPLRLVSIVADAIVDATVYVGGAAIYFGSQIVTQLLSLMLGTVFQKSSLGYVESLAKRAHYAANGAAGRLSELFASEGPVDFGLLVKSIQARQSLHSMKTEVVQTVSLVVRCVSGASYHLQNSTFLEMFSLLNEPVKTGLQQAAASYTWVRGILRDGMTEAVNNGSFTFTVNDEVQPLDPSLAIWTSMDRFLTVLVGYMFLAMIGTMYLLRKDSFFQSPSLQKIEKTFADLLKQAGGVLKVILIISIEMLAFPLYCGLLLDCALLPLFEHASVATRLAFAVQSPWLFAFLHWFIGTCYMFHFALFVSMCRRVMRSGVLYFIRDPDDPTFHPVRDVLERSVTTQLRKIAFSGLVYGGLVIVCLGGAVWSISRVFGIFPVRWARPEADLEFPIDFLGYNLLAPVVASYLFPSKGMEKVFGRWLKLCARSLRLSQFLFGERRKVEEGHVKNESWINRFNPWKNERTIVNSNFIKDGKYVRVPATDQVRIPRGERVFLEVTEHDQRIDGTDSSNGVHGRQPGNFTQVYIPPWFRMRIFAFISCLWMFAIAMGFGVTIVPMVCGRQVISIISPRHVVPNDLYAFAIGLVSLGVVLQVLINGRKSFKNITRQASKQSLAVIGESTKKQAGRLIRSAYVYGFAVVIVPSLFALVLQLYFVLPLHTYMGPAAMAENSTNIITGGAEVGLVNATMKAVSESSEAQPVAVSHTFHILQDWTLGFIYGRVVLRLLLLSRNSRPAAALRMITRDGFTDPNVRLATRAFVVPTLLLFSIVLFWPPLVASVLDKAVLADSVSGNLRTKVYRYSYPICASQVLGLWCAWELAKGLQRWRGRIKDEVYLIGERLHNFGERRPPDGSKSVVRRHS